MKSKTISRNAYYLTCAIIGGLVGKVFPLYPISIDILYFFLLTLGIIILINISIYNWEE